MSFPLYRREERQPTHRLPLAQGPWQRSGTLSGGDDLFQPTSTEGQLADRRLS